MNPALIAVLTAIGAGLSKALISMLTSLLTESVLKKLIILGLKKVVDKTQNETDNQILSVCLEAWGEPELAKEEKGPTP